MTFKLDENLPLSAQALLIARGFDCHNVHDEGLAGGSDQDLIQACLHEKRHLITLDLDFADIVTYPPHAHHGVVIFRLSRQDPPFVVARLSAVLDDLVQIGLTGRLVIISDTRIRYR